MVVLLTRVFALETERLEVLVCGFSSSSARWKTGLHARDRGMATELVPQSPAPLELRCEQLVIWSFCPLRHSHNVALQGGDPGWEERVGYDHVDFFASSAEYRWMTRCSYNRFPYTRCWYYFALREKADRKK